MAGLLSTAAPVTNGGKQRNLFGAIGGVATAGLLGGDPILQGVGLTKGAEHGSTSYDQFAEHPGVNIQADPRLTSGGLYDPNTGAPNDPMAYQGSLLDSTTQGAISKQAGQGAYAGDVTSDPLNGGLLAAGTRDFAGERSQDLKGVPSISQYSRGMTSPEDVNSAIGAGYAQRNSEHMADLERKITREEPVYRAKAEARAAKNLIASEQVRFKNWTLRQQQKLQALQLQQQLDGAKDQLVGEIVGAGGAAVGFVAGGPAGAAAGAAGGNALGQAAARG